MSVNDMHIQIGTNWLSMYDSLLSSVDLAGGDPNQFKAEYIMDKDLAELFGALATNGVRFYCTKTHELVKKPTCTVDQKAVEERYKK